MNVIHSSVKRSSQLAACCLWFYYGFDGSNNDPLFAMPCYLGMVLNNPISDRLFVWIMVYQNALGKVISLLVCWFEQYLTHKMNQIQINIVIKAISKNNCIYGCVRHVVLKFLIHKKSVKIISISPVRSEKVIGFSAQEVRKSQKMKKIKSVSTLFG